jgi:DNA-binding FrmR family transcriptional regulator
MTAAVVTASEPVRIAEARQDVVRLRKATGQLSSVTGKVEKRRYCIDSLDALAALDAVALLVLSDHVNACVSGSIETGYNDAKNAELTAAVPRYVRSGCGEHR